MIDEREFILIEEDELLEEDKVEDIPKDAEFNLETVEEETEQTEEPKGLDVLKEKGLISKDSVTGTLVEEKIDAYEKHKGSPATADEVNRLIDLFLFDPNNGLIVNDNVYR